MVLTILIRPPPPLLLLSRVLHFLPSGLVHRWEKIACPTPLKGLHFSPSSVVANAESIPSTNWTPLGSSLSSYVLHCPVSSPRFNLRSRVKYRSVSSAGPGNQAATLLKVGRASRLTTLSLENPSLHGRKFRSQPVSGSLVLADNNGRPFCPMRVHQPGCESLFRELIYKPAYGALDSSLLR
jgi:hypothetical protein